MEDSTDINRENRVRRLKSDRVNNNRNNQLQQQKYFKSSSLSTN